MLVKKSETIDTFKASSGQVQYVRKAILLQCVTISIEGDKLFHLYYYCSRGKKTVLVGLGEAIYAIWK